MKARLLTSWLFVECKPQERWSRPKFFVRERIRARCYDKVTDMSASLTATDPADVVLSLPEWYPLKNIFRTVDRRDGMFVHNGAEHYLRVGLSALEAIERATEEISPATILDMACGFGRVTRALRGKFPDSRITVCDLTKEGVDFCAAHFNARGVYATTDFSTLDLKEKYNLIWVGSLITHIDAEQIRAFFHFLRRHLASRGHAVVTSCGPFVAGVVSANWHSKQPAYGIVVDKLGPMLDSFFKTGFAYADYPNQEGYGIALCSENWLRTEIGNAGGIMKSYTPIGWDNHQDVVSFV